MQIELVNERSYTVKANGREIKGMRVVDTWNGLEKLEDSKGRFLIVAEAEGPHSSGMREAFGSLFGNEGRRVVAFFGSPDLVMELTTTAAEVAA